MADISVSFDIYDAEAVRILQEEDPDLLPDYSVNAGKDLAYNKKQVTNAITSGIIKGESIPKIANNLQSTMKNLNQRSAIGAARTAATSAHNAGKLSTMKELAAMGVEVQKEWVATLDDRTRESHRKLDGERRDLDERFSNGLMYPGASGSSKETWRCRCTMVSYIPEYDSNDESRLTYGEWVQEKEGSGRVYNKNENGGGASNGVKQENLLDSLKNNHVKYNPVQKSYSKTSERKIIDTITQDDNTCGACVSTALAYCGRKAGYNVTDYRGGRSLRCFAKNAYDWISNTPELKTEKATGSSSYAAAIVAISKIESGNQYLMMAGEHAAILRISSSGNLQYLELQSEEEKGWNDFRVGETLNERFGCNETKFNEVIITNIENFKNVKEFSKILGYINTN